VGAGEEADVAALGGIVLLLRHRKPAAAER